MNQRILAAVIVSLVWGSEWLGNDAVADLPRFELLTARCLVAAVALLPILVRERLSAVERRSRSAVPVFKNIVLGAIVIALPALFFANRTDLSPGLVVLLFATMPIVTSILEEGSGLRNAPALLGGVAGTAFLVRGGLSFSLSQTVSICELLIALILISAALVRAKRWLQGASIAGSVTIQMASSACVFAIYSVVRDGVSFAGWNGGALGVVLLLGTVSGALGYLCFYWLIRSAQVSQAAAVQWLVPVTGIAETAIWLKHLPTWDSVMGGLLAVGSAWFFLRGTPDFDEPLTLQITEVSHHENRALRS